MLDTPTKRDQTLPIDVDKYTNIGWGFLLFIVIASFIWAAIAPLDKGVASFGFVVSDTYHKEIRYLQGGIVDEIFVKEGSFVKKDQVLIKINPTSFESNLNAQHESKKALQETNKSIESSIQYKKGQLEILESQEKSISELIDLGYVPKNKLQDIQKEILQFRSQISEEYGNIEKNKKQINEIIEKQKATSFELQNTLIKAPVDGIVMGLNIHTKGGSIVPGSHLMDILPSNESLFIESQIPINLIDKVHPNLPVYVMFTAFNQNRTPQIPAKIVYVSPDKYTDEKTGNSYYKIRAEVDTKGLKLIKDLEIRAGMPVEVIVKTGERSLLNYLLKPFVDRSYSAFKEE